MPVGCLQAAAYAPPKLGMSRSHSRGRTRAVTREPSGIGPAASSTMVETVTWADMLATRSRNVMNCVGALRRLISTTCASTHTSPSLPTQSFTAPMTRPRGWGCSAELFRAMAAPYRPPPTVAATRGPARVEA